MLKNSFASDFITSATLGLVSVGWVGSDFPQPKIRLAIAGRKPDGWYSLGKITVQE